MRAVVVASPSAGLRARRRGERPARLEAQLGYGFSVLDGRAVATPHLSWSRSGESGALTLGQRLKTGAWEWCLKSAVGDDERTYGVCYGYRVGDALSLTVDARRREPANMEGTLQHETTTQCFGIATTGPGTHFPDGPKAYHALTIKLYHSTGADHLITA